MAHIVGRAGKRCPTVAKEILGAFFVAAITVLVYIGFGLMVEWP